MPVISYKVNGKNFNVCASVHQNVLKLKNIFWAFILCTIHPRMDGDVVSSCVVYVQTWKLCKPLIFWHYLCSFHFKIYSIFFSFLFPFNDDKTGISMGFLSFRSVQSKQEATNIYLFMYAFVYVWKSIAIYVFTTRTTTTIARNIKIYLF